MASFKELMQAFLYEDVADDEDEEEIDEAAVAEYSRPAPTITVTEEAKDTQLTTPVAEAVYENRPEPAVRAQAAPVYSAVQPAPAEQVTEVRTSIFSGLDMEDISAPERTPAAAKAAPGRKNYRYDRSKIAKPVRRAPEQNEYEAVISPIFGNLEDEEKKFESVHNAVNLPKPEEGQDITSVISPMFGSGQSARQPVDHIPEYQPRPAKMNKKKKAAPNKEERKPADSAVKPIRDVADLLTREPVASPAVKKDESKADQLSLESAE